MRLPRLLAVLVLAAGPALAAPSARPATEADLPAAREAFQRRDLTALENWKRRFAGHPLEAYPAYWALSLAIDKADPAEVRSFLKRHADTPLADPLRRDWLKALGAAGQWTSSARSSPRSPPTTSRWPVTPCRSGSAAATPRP